MFEGVDFRISRTINKLPPKVRKWVYLNCDFISVTKGGGHCFYLSEPSRYAYLIILGEKPDESVIAHEIAHARLGQDNVITSAQQCKKSERKACSLTKKWGFSGPGTNLAEVLGEKCELPGPVRKETS